MDKNLLKSFWVLAESNEHTRVNCTLELIANIKEKQGDSKKHCDVLTYTLDRLIKGLASPRKVARLGFTTALAQVLRDFPIVKVGDIIDKVADHLQINKSDYKSDQSNVYIGRMMVYLALIQSGKILKAKHDDIKRITQAILHVWKKKVPLHEMCAQVLVDLMSKISREDFDAQMWPLLEEKLSCGWEKATPDIFWLLLVAQQYHQGDKLDKAYFSTHWKTKNLLNKENNASLSNIIVQCTADHPILHPVCIHLLHETAKKANHFEMFWAEVIYGKVFHSGTNCKFLVFQLIPVALKLTTLPKQVYTILSPSLIACLLKNLSNNQQVLHSAAKRLIQDLIKVCSDLAGPLQIAMVMTLVNPPGTVLFDSVTKTACIQSMMPKLSVEAIKGMSKILMDNIQGKIMVRANNTDEESRAKCPDLATQQKWSTSMLSNFVNQTMLMADHLWCNSVTEFLFVMAYFEVLKPVDGLIKPNMPLGHAIRHTISLALFRALDKMVKFLSKGVKGYQIYNDNLHHIVQHAQLLLDSNAVKVIKTFDGQVLESWQKMMAVTQKIKKKRGKSSVSMKDELAFELLFLHHGLQLFTEQKSSMEVLKELHTCYNKANEKRLRRSVITKPGDEPEWVDVIVDLLMSLLSQQSHLVRVVVSTVFTMLCPHLTRDSLQLILEPFEPTDDSDKNPLHFEESEEEDEEEDEKNSNESEEDSKSDSSSDEEVGENNVDEQLKSSVKSALGGAAANSDQEESSEDFDDEAMFRLDGALAAAFKGTAQAKKKQEQEKEMQLRHYKMRCLDILEVVISHCKSADLLLDLVLPLLSLMEAGVSEKSQQELGNRAHKIFSQLVNAKKLNSEASLDSSVFPEMVKNLMEYSTKVSGIPMIKDTASACVFVIQQITSAESHTGPSPVKTRAMAANKVGKQKESREQEIRIIDRVLHIVEEGLEDFCVKRDSRLSHYFFLGMLQKEPTLFWPLAESILDHVIASNVRIFCRTQASAMLAALISKSSIQHVEKTSWVTFATQIIDTISTLLEKGEKEVLKPRYLLELLVLLHRVCVVLDDSTRQELISEDLLRIVNQLKTSVASDTRIIINKISGTCASSMVGSDLCETKKKKKKQKRKNRESKSEGKSSSSKKPKLSTSGV